MAEILIGSMLLVVFAATLWLPAWWFAAYLDSNLKQSPARLPAALGVALVAYLSFVNLLGRLIEDSIRAASIYLVLNLVFCALLLWKDRIDLGVSFLWHRKRSWLAVLLIALVLAIPQWFQAVSGNRWDEMASSATHITAPNQFAEGVFPPRHNAFPDIALKYHYGFTMLSGTVNWVAGLSSNVSVDVASTALWLFIFLFTYSWLSQLGTSRIAAVWGGFAVLLGGGFSWAYLPSLRVYEGYQKLPLEGSLVHSYDANASWWSNLLSVMENQNIHLANAEGNIFPLPFDIAIHFQQHAVALGIALSLVAAYVFWLWQTKRNFSPALMVLSIFCFGLVFLGHSVFGSIASASAGLTLALLWVLSPSWRGFWQGIFFTLGVTVLAFLHGGMLTPGDEYGPPGAPIAIRDQFGYISGSWLDQLNWGLAAFGLLLIFTLLALWHWFRRRQSLSRAHVLLIFFGLFALVSFTIPQLVYFSHAGGVEEQTEISKFFFCTHFALAVLSAFGLDYLSRHLRWWALLPFFVMTAISPVAVSIAGSVDKKGEWVGFYKSPYAWEGGQNNQAAGEALRSMKKSSLDQYYDFSAHEVSSKYLSELLVYGGSVFTLSPTRYEVTGFGFLISEERVADRILQESRMALLTPGAAEASGTDWIYASTIQNVTARPVVVRSRFRKMVAEGMLVKRFSAGPRELFEVAADTQALDQGIEKYWTPKIISQGHSDWDGDGKMDLLFFDYLARVIHVNGEKISLPRQLASQPGVPMVFPTRLQGDNRTDLLVAQSADAVYRRGETVSAMVRYYPYSWHILDSRTGQWQEGRNQWYWILPLDIPLVADLDNDGIDSRLAYRMPSRQWISSSNSVLSGPNMPAHQSPLPLVGRFLAGSSGDLALWSPITGQFKARSLSSGRSLSLEWGGQPGDVLLPGDYDGDGYDELAIWQPHSNMWWVRNLASGSTDGYSFGSPSGVPLPADYDGDGRLDLAYWEPELREIYVSFDLGQSVGRVIAVPSNSIPVFVQMY